MSVTSISNTKKITAKRKNLILKGTRVLFTGSNPHSKGDLFSGNTISFQLKTRQQNSRRTNREEIIK